MARIRGATRLSSRNQITLPIEVVRKLGLRTGTRLFVEDFGETILLVPDVPEEQEQAVGTYGRTAEEVATYIAAERATWKE
jgi:bifunctional DNA-binding transcriptional regulator/antitoxin component of YhaV-PrlF toxin-antitoxin module